MPNEITLQIALQIESDERVLWHDVPEQGLRLYPVQGIMMAAAVFLSLVFAFVLWSYWQTGANLNELTPFAVFVLVFDNAWLVHPILDVVRRERTSYVLTNRRVLINSGLLRRRVQSIDIRSLPKLEFHAKSDGRGSVMLGQAYTGLTAHGISSVINPPALDGIEDGKRVYDMIEGIWKGKPIENEPTRIVRPSLARH